MPDWKSPEEVQKDGIIFGKFMHSLFGLYAQVLFESFSIYFDITISPLATNGLFLSISSGNSSQAKRSFVGQWSVPMHIESGPCKGLTLLHRYSTLQTDISCCSP